MKRKNKFIEKFFIRKDYGISMTVPRYGKWRKTAKYYYFSKKGGFMSKPITEYIYYLGEQKYYDCKLQQMFTLKQFVKHIQKLENLIAFW